MNLNPWEMNLEVVGGGVTPTSSPTQEYNTGNIRTSASNPEFRKYSTVEEGVADHHRLLRDYQSKHGLTTIKDVINRWAPPSENDTSNYVKFMSQKMGMNPDDTIDFNDPETLGKFSYYQAQMEKGANKVPVSMDEMIGIAGGSTKDPWEQGFEVAQEPWERGLETEEQLPEAPEFVPETEMEKDVAKAKESTGNSFLDWLTSTSISDEYTTKPKKAVSMNSMDIDEALMEIRNENINRRVDDLIAKGVDPIKAEQDARISYAADEFSDIVDITIGKMLPNTLKQPLKARSREVAKGLVKYGAMAATSDAAGQLAGNYASVGSLDKDLMEVNPTENFSGEQTAIAGALGGIIGGAMGYKRAPSKSELARETLNDLGKKYDDIIYKAKAEEAGLKQKGDIPEIIESISIPEDKMKKLLDTELADGIKVSDFEELRNTVGDVLNLSKRGSKTGAGTVAGEIENPTLKKLINDSRYKLEKLAKGVTGSEGDLFYNSRKFLAEVAGLRSPRLDASRSAAVKKVMSDSVDELGNLSKALGDPDYFTKIPQLEVNVLQGAIKNLKENARRVSKGDWLGSKMSLKDTEQALKDLKTSDNRAFVDQLLDINHRIETSRKLGEKSAPDAAETLKEWAAAGLGTYAGGFVSGGLTAAGRKALNYSLNKGTRKRLEEIEKAVGGKLEMDSEAMKMLKAGASKGEIIAYLAFKELTKDTSKE